MAIRIACNSYLLLLFLTVCYSPSTLSAQPAIQWQHTYGGSKDDYPYTVQACSDGGYIAAGYTRSDDDQVHGNKGQLDCWVLKLDTSGGIQWQKTLGGSGSEMARSIQQTSDGGYILAGHTSSNDGDVHSNHGEMDFWVVKLSSAGEISWQKTLGGSQADEAYAICQTRDGGYVVAGSSNSTDGDVIAKNSSYTEKCWVLKLNNTGAIVWRKTIESGGLPQAISPTKDGGFVLAGSKLIENQSDFWIAKLNKNGKLLWEKNFGGPYYDFANAICPGKDGGFVVAGCFTEKIEGSALKVPYRYKGGVYKLNAKGDIKWQQILGEGSANGASAVFQAKNGDYLMGGYQVNATAAADCWFFCLNPKGELRWQKTAGGTDPDNISAMQPSGDGGFIFSASSSSGNGDVSGNHGRIDFWIVKCAAE